MLNFFVDRLTGTNPRKLCRLYFVDFPELGQMPFPLNGKCPYHISFTVRKLHYCFNQRRKEFFLRARVYFGGNSSCFLLFRGECLLFNSEMPSKTRKASLLGTPAKTANYNKFPKANYSPLQRLKVKQGATAKFQDFQTFQTP